MKCLSLSVAAFMFAAYPCFAREITFGDDLLNWVNVHAEKRSEDFAKSDFKLRTINLRIRALEQSYAELERMRSQLKRIHTELQASEAKLKNLGPLQAAILRENSADQHLVELMSMHQKLDSIDGQISILVGVPKRQTFDRLGLGHVGRASVVTSFMGMKSAADSLQAQFGVSASITVDENGAISDVESEFDFRATDSDVEYAVDSIVLNFAKKYPKLAVIYGMLKVAALGQEIEKYRDQRRKVQQAVAALPSKLVSSAKQFQIYSDASLQAQAQFADNFETLGEMSVTLRGSVKYLFSLSLSRANLARNSLNQSKLDTIAAQYEQGLLRDAIDERSIITTANELRDYHSNLITREIEFLNGCSNVNGLAAAENWQDGLTEARALYEEIANEGRMAPLRSTLENLLGQINPFLSDSVSEMLAISKVSCAPDPWIKARTTKPTPRFSLYIPDTLSEFADLTLPPLKGLMKPYRFQGRTLQFGASLGVGDFCIMMGNGQDYYCGHLGDGGTGHFSQFPNNGSSALANVLGSSGDGGYRPSDRQYQAVTADADQNLRNRMLRMENEVSALTQALPEWKQANLEAAAETSTELDKQLEEIGGSFDGFSASLGLEFDELNGRLRQYIFAPADIAQMGALAAEYGGSDTSLRRLRDDQVMPDSPQITGIGVWDRVYAQTDLGARALVRELRKHEVDRVAVLARFNDLEQQGQSDPVFPDEDAMQAALKMSMTTLAYAKAFASPSQDVVEQLGVEEVDRLFKGYLDDARQMRYHASGLLNYEKPPDLDGITSEDVRSHVLREIGEFYTCTAQHQDLESRTPCNVFMHKAMKHIYNINDFDSKTQKANQMIAAMEASDKWVAFGNAGNQGDLNDAGLFAAQGRAVVAAWPNEGGIGHVAIVLPGTPSGVSGKPQWAGLRLPDVANFALDDFVGDGQLDYTSPSIKITYAFGGDKLPSEVILYVREYGN